MAFNQRIDWFYKEKRRSNPPKRTMQITFDGEIVRVWESTAAIRRELGLNDKVIQAVCRKENKSAYGYIWKYEDEKAL